MSYPRYPKYKDSGVEWLGEVPEGWGAVSIRRLCRLNPSKSEVQLSSDADVAFLPMEAVEADGTFEFQIKTFDEVSSGYTYFHDGDILVAKITPCFENGKGALVHGLPNAVGFGSTEFHVVRAGCDLFPKFLFYIFSQGAFRNIGESEMIGAAGQKRVPGQFISNFYLPLPLLTEQQTIASFLDRETTKIDVLIAEQEKLATLLQEKRQAVISHAVTKGLNPDAPMKDSGVEWLGEVPEGWEVSRLKFVANIQTGIAKGKEYKNIQTILVPYLRVANVQNGFLSLDDLAEIEIPSEDIERYRLRVGDVLMNEGGDFDKLGRGAIWGGEVSVCIHQNHVFAVRPHMVSSEWLNMLTNSQYAQCYFISRSKQSTNLASISSSNLMELPIPLPSEEEQSNILSFICAETAKIDALITESQKAVELLKERRSALISAAVTGKIDVRNIPLQEAV